jgi:glyoxylase-like metal-dependent hydrolase (beta-lactamase superfamily II)
VIRTSRSRSQELPVATSWFEVDWVDADLVKVTEPHLNGLVSANLWWVRGTHHDVVVDTGLGVASLRTHVPELFDHDPLAVVTHTHLDHVGGAHEFPRVAVHEAEVAAVAAPEPASLHPPTELALLGLAVPAGTELPPSLLRALPERGYDPDTYAVRPAEVTRTLVEGDLIDLGGTVLRVLHLPGHSPGSIVLLDEERRRLFTGDVVYDDELLDEMRGTDIAAYVASMRRLLELDVEVVHPGHGPTFDGARLREIAEDYVARRG